MIESCITFLPVSNLGKDSPILYRGGWTDRLEGHGKLCHLRLREGYWGFCQYNDGRPLATGTCMSLNCESCAEVDEQYRRLTALGIQTQGQPKRHAIFPVYSFFFADPDGYLLEFQKIVDAE